MRTVDEAWYSDCGTGLIEGIKRRRGLVKKQPVRSNERVIMLGPQALSEAPEFEVMQTLVSCDIRKFRLGFA